MKINIISICKELKYLGSIWFYLESDNWYYILKSSGVSGKVVYCFDYDHENPWFWTLIGFVKQLTFLKAQADRI